MFKEWFMDLVEGKLALATGGTAGIGRASRGSGDNFQHAIGRRGGVSEERWRKRGCHVCAAARLVTLMGSFFMALVPMSAQSAGSLQEKPIMTKQTIAVEHIRIESAKSFADVRAALERNVPRLDRSVIDALHNGDVARVNREKEQGPALAIFQVRDHGALLNIAGKARNALQYDIGNPITASLMTRHRLAAALYAPIRVVLYENDTGHGVFEYDQPSTTFGQFGDEPVTTVARELDAELSRALLGAAE
jgi:uncharacterized protein (DUF302 family)